MATSTVHLVSTWDGGFKGKGKIEGEDFDVGIAIPVSLGGSGNGAGPKELYTSAAAACFLSTLRAITENKKLPLESLAVETNAEVEDDHFALTHVIDLRLNGDATEADIASAHKMIDSADKICLIGNLIRKAGGTIELEPKVKLPA